MHRSPTLFALTLALALLAPTALRADVIYLENGGKVQGKILEETSRVVTIQTKAGKLKVQRAEIARIVREEDARTTFQARAAKLEKSRDAAAWCDLGTWAREKLLEEEAERCFKRAIELDATCEPAHLALGHKQHQGRWYDEDGYRREVLGLVPYEDRWVTAEEKAKLEAGLVLVDGHWVLPPEEDEPGDPPPRRERPEPSERSSPDKPKKPEASDEGEDTPRSRGGRGAKFRAISFNIRFDFSDDGPNRWQHRVSAVAKVIQTGVVVGIQEDKAEQVDDLRPLLPGYEIVGTGRNPGGSGERCSILVKKDEARIRDWGEFWLSDTPDVKGSNTWGDRYPRKVTWALIELKGAKTPLLFLNTHLPERDDGRDPENRIKGCRVMNEFIQKKLPEKERKKTALLITGDYNSTPEDEPRKALVGDLPIRDAWNETPHQGPSGTFNDFKGIRNNHRIDWVLLGGPVQANQIQVFAEQVDGRWPSDHYPLMAELGVR